MIAARRGDHRGRATGGKVRDQGTAHVRTDPTSDRPFDPDDVRRGGIIAFFRLNIEAYPNPAPVILEITAQTAGLSAEEMERYFTIPIEVGLAATPGV